jgi:hypothetical protein
MNTYQVKRVRKQNRPRSIVIRARAEIPDAVLWPRLPLSKVTGCREADGDYYVNDPEL